MEHDGIEIELTKTSKKTESKKPKKDLKKQNGSAKSESDSEISENEDDVDDEDDQEEEEEDEDLEDDNSEIEDEDEEMDEDEDDEHTENDQDEDDDENDEEEEDEEEDETVLLARQKGLKEDIYGRLVDKTGKVVEVETRQRASDKLQQLLDSKNSALNGNGINGPNQQQRIKLNKLFQGLFNRLSTANMHSISNQIIQIFYSNEYTRYDIIDTILRILTTSLIRSNCLSPTRLVLEHAALIFVLTNQVGIELGASLVQKLCTRLDTDLKTSESYSIENKTADNLVLLLCNLYNFKLFSANLIIDLLNKTLADKIDDNAR